MLLLERPGILPPLSLRDAMVIVPLVLAILAFAVYPQGAIDAGEAAVQASSQAVTGGAR